jgi:flagellar basal-body rod protein FlgB
MADFKIIDRTFAVLQKSLDLRQQKQQVIAANIANAETPGYAARKMDFEADLRQAIDSPGLVGRKTNAKHIPVGSNGIAGVQGTITRVHDHNPLGDGNSVSVDDEMLDLAENQLLYEAGTQIMKRKLALLRYAAGNGN